MFCYTWIVPLYALMVSAQPLSCKEDSHCSDGFYCELQVNLCLQCLRCQDVKRIEATPPKNICVKSVDSCGPCIEGFVNMHKDGLKGKCVTPELLEVGSKSWNFAYIWVAATCVAFVIVITFSYVIRSTQMFRVVSYFNPDTLESRKRECKDSVFTINCRFTTKPFKVSDVF